MIYVKLALDLSGFTNQIFSLISGILLAIVNGDKIVFVDYFLNDFSKKKYTKISEILNISVINNYLYLKYGVIIVDKYMNDFKFNYVKYGIDNKYYYLNCYNYPLRIKKDTQFNSFYGDPCPNFYKELIMNYSIYGYNINERYPENLKNDLIVDYENSEYISTFSWINTYNKDIFEDILIHIVFNDKLIIQSQSQIQNIYNMKKSSTNKINVMHLRLESDAIRYWSGVNNMTQLNFKNMIEKKYIDVLKKYIDKEELTIILTDSKINDVFEYLQNEKYHHITLDKMYDDREMNAVIELLVANTCNNKFIGNFNFKKLNGSTFSYFICKVLDSKVEKIMIDLDKIQDDEQVINHC